MSTDTVGPAFAPDPDWLPQHPNPSKPAFTPPPGSVDANVHVFGPGDRFPYAPGRRYTPVDATADELFALHRLLGIDRTVIVQGTAHGTDPRALIDALRRAGGKARGVAAVRPDVTDDELDELHDAGVRGIRFTFIARLADPLDDDEYRTLAERAAARGWHVVASLEPADLVRRAGLLRDLAGPLVIDHLGRPDVTQPVGGAEFELLLQLLRDRPDTWTKVHGAERLSRSGPPGYADLIPFARRVLDEFPDRVMWASDWPHPNMRDHMPDDGALVDLIPRYAPTADLQERMLVRNPMRLYWPDEG
jgi:2-pyrone-4,6-dicarboxylate lactonase